MKKQKAFTLLEILITIVIILILTAIVLITFGKWRANARLSRVSTELVQIANAANQYAQDNNFQYPADQSRGVDPGLGKYLPGGTWPTSAWPHGVFDWDNWTTVGGQPSEQIYQISYHLCNTGDPTTYCSDPALFPHFTFYSSIFYCIQGPCVPSATTPTDPGYFVNSKTHPVNPPL